MREAFQLLLMRNHHHLGTLELVKNLPDLEQLFLAESKKEELVIRREQLTSHQIFTWYLAHWKKKYSNKWTDFIEEQNNTFNFGRKTIAPANSLLAKNLEFVLNKLLERCETFSSENNVKNILLFFYRGESKAPLNINEAFTPIGIDYGKEVLGNYVLL